MKLRVLMFTVLLVLMMPLVVGAAQDNIVHIGSDGFVEENQTTSNVVIIGANAVIKGRVTENVVVIFGDIHLESTAVVEGDVVSVGGAVIKQPGAQTRGENISLDIASLSQIRFPRLGHFWPLRYGWSTSYSLWKVLSIVFLGWVVFWLFPRPVANVATAVTTEPLKAVLYGFLGYLALVPLTLMLVITILGILAVPVLWVGVLVGRLLGQVALGLLAGKYILKALNREQGDVVSVVVGMLALGLLTVLPVVGGLASLFYSLLGFGAVLWTRFGRQSAII